MPLKLDAKVFDAQGILSSGSATDVVVFGHLTVDVLNERNKSASACDLLLVEKGNRLYPSHLF
jgi:hypothetical protein